MSTGHPQVGERKQRHQLRGVLGQTTETRLHITKLALYQQKRMLDFRSLLSLGLLDLALGFLKHAALIGYLSWFGAFLDRAFCLCSWSNSAH